MRSIDIASQRGRAFAPHPLMTLLALAGVAALLALGRWQLHRATDKEALYRAFAAGANSTQVLSGASGALPRYQHVVAAGHYDPERQILIDNMSDAAGRTGYDVITPFELDGGGLVLVNRGWVPIGASRAARPAIPVSAARRTIHGRTDRLPVPGLRLGPPAVLAAPFPVVALFPTQGQIGRLLGAPRFAHAAELVLLDPGEPDGYARDWRAPGFPPLRHIAYAVQWFALALALAVIYVATHLKRSSAGRPPRAQPQP